MAIRRQAPLQNLESELSRIARVETVPADASESDRRQPGKWPPDPTLARATGHPDAALLAGLKALQPEAYETLLDRFEAPLYRFFYYSHGRHDLAEDQCGETFAQAIVAIQKMRGDAGALSAFIFGIARNVMRRGWREKKLYSLGEAQGDLIADRQPSVWRQAADRQAWEQAIAAIESLGEPARQVVLLRFVEEMSLEEIAEAMEMPLGSVKSAIHRSRKRLKSLLEMQA